MAEKVEDIYVKTEAKKVSGIDSLVTYRINNAPFDRTYTGTIIKVLFNESTLPTDKLYNKYTVKFNGMESNVYIADSSNGMKHVIGEQVRIHIPNNVLTNKYTEVINNGRHPDKVVCDSILHTITEYWDNEKEPNKPFKQVYKFTVINEGQETEEVTALQYPDKTIMTLEGFVIGQGVVI